jgi:hypothetical protein
MSQGSTETSDLSAHVEMAADAWSRSIPEGPRLCAVEDFS